MDYALIVLFGVAAAGLVWFAGRRRRRARIARAIGVVIIAAGTVALVWFNYEMRDFGAMTEAPARAFENAATHWH